MTQLERLSKGKELLEGLRPLPADVAAELKHLYEVRLTHHSTAIEGNTLTQSETEIVLDKGITIAGKSVAEHLEVIGHKEAMDFMLDLTSAEGSFGEREIRELHSLVMKGQDVADRGGYRTLDVRAAGTEFRYPSHLHVAELMADFSAWLGGPEGHPILFASEAHLRFVTIHPFRDGNGRVGRLLLNFLLVRAGYPIAVIRRERRSEYIDALVSAQEDRGRGALDDLVMAAVGESLRDVLQVCLDSEAVRARSGGLKEVEGWIR